MSMLEKMIKGSTSASLSDTTREQNNGASNLIDFKSETIDTIKPMDFILVNSGTYQDQHHRSWTSPKNSRALKNIINAVRDTSSTSISPALIGSVGGLLRVEAQSQGVAVIPNSWGTERGIFLLNIKFNLRDGSTLSYVVQGFTDTADFTQTSISPNLVFHINNVIALRPIMSMRAGAKAAGFSITKNYQPLSVFTEQNGTHDAATKLLVRPYDVFGRLASGALVGQGYNVTDYGDKLGANRREMPTSRRTNSIPTIMVSKMVGAFVNTTQLMADEYEVTSGDIAERATATVAERDAVDDSFFEMIRSHTSMSSSSFTWSQLLRVAPGIDTIRREVRSSGRGVNIRSRGESDGLGNSSATTQAMSNLQSALPSLMLECGLTSLTLASTNRTPLRQPETSVYPAIAFDSSMLANSLRTFTARFNQEIAPTLCDLDNGHEYTLSATCSYNGDIDVKIDVNGDESFMVAPAFCDSIFAPTINSSAEKAADVTERIGTICSVISDSVNVGIIKRNEATLQELDSRNPSEAGIRQGSVIGVASQTLGNRTLGSNSGFGGVGGERGGERSGGATPWGGGGGFGNRGFGRRG